MKILNQFNDITKKVAKGMIAIFAIKLILIGGLFIFQSCQLEATSSDDNLVSKNNFLKSLGETENNLNLISLKKSEKGNNFLSRNM
jgi:hypothetical protein